VEVPAPTRRATWSRRSEPLEGEPGNHSSLSCLSTPVNTAAGAASVGASVEHEPAEAAFACCVADLFRAVGACLKPRGLLLQYRRGRKKTTDLLDAGGRSHVLIHPSSTPWLVRVEQVHSIAERGDPTLGTGIDLVSSSASSSSCRLRSLRAS